WRCRWQQQQQRHRHNPPVHSGLGAGPYPSGRKAFLPYQLPALRNSLSWSGLPPGPRRRRCFLWYSRHPKQVIPVSKFIEELPIVVARHDERIEDLEDWRKAVNGDLRTIRNRIMWVGWGVASTLLTTILNLVIRLLAG